MNYVFKSFQYNFIILAVYITIIDGYRTTRDQASKNDILASEAAPHAASCSDPRDQGDCGGQEEAWYYDPNDRQCYFFLYSGCGGNRNRFPTLATCKLTCVKEPSCKHRSCPKGCITSRRSGRCPKCLCSRETSLKICLQEQRREHCRALQYKWSYSNREGKCVKFVYGGCGGNENNFDTREECQMVCGGL